MPILLSGPDADAALEILTGLGMDARVEQGPIGRASSIKMFRSIMVMGMEATDQEAKHNKAAVKSVGTGFPVESGKKGKKTKGEVLKGQRVRGKKEKDQDSLMYF